MHETYSHEYIYSATFTKIKPPKKELFFSICMRYSTAFSAPCSHFVFNEQKYL